MLKYFMIQKWFRKRALLKKGFVVCPHCKEITHLGNYCESCGAQLKNPK